MQQILMGVRHHEQIQVFLDRKDNSGVWKSEIKGEIDGNDVALQ